MGLDRDLHRAMTLAARNAIKFLAAQAKITELDAYALCSIAVSFRHALIPKSIFTSELRQQMKMV
jgi:acetamidase/formamidase